MASAEVIGLLCAGSTCYHDVGRGGAGGVLPRSELAGLLAGLSDQAMNLALAKWACDLDAERMLIAQVRVWAANRARDEGWQVVRGRPTIANLSALAVFEVVRPNRCKNGCRLVQVGRSERWYKGGRLCPSCNGTGFKALSGRQIAEAMQIDQCNFSRLWKSRYEACYQFVSHLDSNVLSLLRAADRRDDFWLIEIGC